MTTTASSDRDHAAATVDPTGTIRVDRGDDGVVTIRLGSPDESMVTLTEVRLRSLESALDDLQKDTTVRGVIVTGPCSGMFAAGADISLIEKIDDPKAGAEAAAFGQELFGRFQRLACPVVGAIEGPCLGGGLELALGFDVRVSSDHPSTKIGLPEVKLGIIPGFGGTQRLTRLIGLPKALDLILKGKLLDPKRALRTGVVDRVVPSQRLLAAARQELDRRIDSGRKSPRRKLRGLDKWVTKLGPLRRFVARKVRKTLSSGPARFYDAPKRALDSCVDAVSLSPAVGFQKEATALGELIASPTCKGLVRLYFLTERSKRLGKTDTAPALENALVVGGGVMGGGIAGTLAARGLRVRLCDVVADNLARAKARLQRGLDKRLKRRQLERHEARAAQDRLTVAAEWGNLSRCDLFVEAVPESLALKRELFGKAVEAGLRSDAILATNTSSLPVDRIGEGLPSPERVIGIHFFNPPEKMPLVEVVVGANTGQTAIDATCRLATRLGKFPIIVRDRPGFLVNRCLAPYLDEAARLMLEGHQPEFIDRVMLDFGMPMGPARLLDEIGFDVALKVSEVLAAAFPDRMEPAPLFAAMVDAQCLGQKADGGLYDRTGRKPGPGRPVLARLRDAGADGGQSRSEVTARLIYRMIDETYRCIEDGIVESFDDVDLGMVMGIGFPPFTGGISRFARTEGIAQIAATLERLAAKHGKRFQPSRALRNDA